ncbi:MAG: acylneuraminate cytidylyltransferase family protein [Candidatus Desulfaltia sp.]|nr:acylneuraminate cytidylyltransferase family protein [Candidatus Desulfaltia sp.]
MKITALQPMKAHSERMPNKNIKNFCGRPLYHAVLSSLFKSKYIDKVIINTDSDIIKEDAIKNFERVVIIDRPGELQGDFVSMNDIIAYDLSKIDSEHFLQTHSTNPLLRTETIDFAIETYFKNLNEFDSLFSVTRLQTRLYWKDSSPINHNPIELLRTQDLSPVYEENSNFYIFSKKSFTNAAGSRIGRRPKMFEIGKLEAIDIDEPEDWEIAEILYMRRVIK